MCSLQIEEVTLHNHGDEIISSWNASFVPGESISIYSGKQITSTSILLMLGGYLKPEQGAVWMVEEEKKEKISPAHIGIASIHRIYEPIPYLRVEEMLLLQANLFRVKHKKMLLEKVMDDWDLDGVRKDRYVDLSPVNQLKASIAAALVHQPPILLLDHPELGLTDEEWSQFSSVLQPIVQRDKLILILTTLRREVWNEHQTKIDLSIKKEDRL
ncbi:ATP-binding cassette domain-containing protein [Baia soyae]|uniref:ABC transporter family protein n=1 Tax=Baia soyae TaxID=1544746 RepID=A0A4R2RVT9_9BACL|nr:ATP-binding cassette domain-containing protein [Baia soyae]TCP67069.1 ABC transporter family protein [Baia soyae]